MLIRSRSARFAALALAAATPLVASYAAPAFADGSDADVTASFGKPGFVTVSSSKGLSRVTIVTCDGDLVVADSWNGAQLGDVAVDGDVRAVFIHSGNNTTDEAQALLELLAPGASNGSSTGEIAFDESCEDASDDDDSDDDDSDDDGSDDDGSDDDSDDTTTVSPIDVSDPDPVTTTAGPSTNPTPSTDVLGVTVEKASSPANTDVLGQTVPQPAAELPRTGAVHLQFLTTLALTLLAAGIALRAAFGRRIRSASSPG